MTIYSRRDFVVLEDGTLASVYKSSATGPVYLSPLNHIGYGGTADVQRCWKRVNGNLRPFALKLARTDDARLEACCAELLEQEARILQQLRGVPRIVQLESSGTWQSMPYIIMEYLSGVTLEVAAAEAANLPSKGAWLNNAAVQLLKAVSELHCRGVAWQDGSLRNVMCQRDGSGNIEHLTLIDFGTSQTVDEGGMLWLDQVGFCATLRFAAPELIYLESAFGDADYPCVKYDALAADCWSLGVMLFTVITRKDLLAPAQRPAGHTGTPVSNRQHTMDHLRRCHAQNKADPDWQTQTQGSMLRSGASPELANLVMGLLSFDCRRRWRIKLALQQLGVLPRDDSTSGAPAMPKAQGDASWALDSSPSIGASFHPDQDVGQPSGQTFGGLFGQTQGGVQRYGQPASSFDQTQNVVQPWAPPGHPHNVPQHSGWHAHDHSQDVMGHSNWPQAHPSTSAAALNSFAPPASKPLPLSSPYGAVGSTKPTNTTSAMHSAQQGVDLPAFSPGILEGISSPAVHAGALGGTWGQAETRPWDGAEMGVDAELGGGFQLGMGPQLGDLFSSSHFADAYSPLVGSQAANGSVFGNGPQFASSNAAASSAVGFSSFDQTAHINPWASAPTSSPPTDSYPSNSGQACKWYSQTEGWSQHSPVGSHSVLAITTAADSAAVDSGFAGGHQISQGMPAFDVGNYSPGSGHPGMACDDGPELGLALAGAAPDLGPGLDAADALQLWDGLQLDDVLGVGDALWAGQDLPGNAPKPDAVLSSFGSSAQQDTGGSFVGLWEDSLLPIEGLAGVFIISHAQPLWRFDHSSFFRGWVGSETVGWTACLVKKTNLILTSTSQERSNSSSASSHDGTEDGAGGSGACSLTGALPNPGEGSGGQEQVHGDDGNSPSSAVGHFQLGRDNSASQGKGNFRADGQSWADAQGSDNDPSVELLALDNAESVESSQPARSHSVNHGSNSNSVSDGSVAVDSTGSVDDSVVTASDVSLDRCFAEAIAALEDDEVLGLYNDVGAFVQLGGKVIMSDDDLSDSDDDCSETDASCTDSQLSPEASMAAESDADSDSDPVSGSDSDSTSESGSDCTHTSPTQQAVSPDEEVLHTVDMINSAHSALLLLQQPSRPHSLTLGKAECTVVGPRLHRCHYSVTQVSSHVVTLHDLMSQPSEAQAGILIQLVIPVACQLLKVFELLHAQQHFVGSIVPQRVVLEPHICLLDYTAGAVSLSAPSLGPGPLNMPQGSNGEAGAAASCEAVSDLQSLGVLLYAMATGSAPFTWEDLPEQDLGAPSSDQDGETTAGQPELTAGHWEEGSPARCRLLAHVDASIAELVWGLLAPCPTERLTAAQALALPCLHCTDPNEATHEGHVEASRPGAIAPLPRSSSLLWREGDTPDPTQSADGIVRSASSMPSLKQLFGTDTAGAEGNIIRSSSVPCHAHLNAEDNAQGADSGVDASASSTHTLEQRDDVEECDAEDADVGQGCSKRFFSEERPLWATAMCRTLASRIFHQCKEPGHTAGVN